MVCCSVKSGDRLAVLVEDPERQVARTVGVAGQPHVDEAVAARLRPGAVTDGHRIAFAGRVGVPGAVRRRVEHDPVGVGRRLVVRAPAEEEGADGDEREQPGDGAMHADSVPGAVKTGVRAPSIRGTMGTWRR